nr:hypothetical protein [Tanacetum cinerariifolium]
MDLSAETGLPAGMGLSAETDLPAGMGLLAETNLPAGMGVLEEEANFFPIDLDELLAEGLGDTEGVLPAEAVGVRAGDTEEDFSVGMDEASLVTT